MKVVCINNYGTQSHNQQIIPFTIGKVYNICHTSSNMEYYFLYGDDGIYRLCGAWCFEIYNEKEVRKQKLEKLYKI